MFFIVNLVKEDVRSDLYGQFAPYVELGLETRYKFQEMGFLDKTKILMPLQLSRLYEKNRMTPETLYLMMRNTRKVKFITTTISNLRK